MAWPEWCVPRAPTQAYSQAVVDAVRLDMAKDSFGTVVRSVLPRTARCSPVPHATHVVGRASHKEARSAAVPAAARRCPCAHAIAQAERLESTIAVQKARAFLDRCASLLSPSRQQRASRARTSTNPRVSSLAPCADSAPPRMTTTCSARSMSRWSKCTWRCLAFRSARAAAAAAPARRRAAVPPARGASALTRTCNALACTVRLELIDATESGVTSDEDKKKLDQERAECACSRPHAALSHHPRARHRHRHRVCCLELVEPCLAVDAGRALAAIPRAWSILVPACARWGVVQ